MRSIPETSGLQNPRGGRWFWLEKHETSVHVSLELEGIIWLVGLIDQFSILVMRSSSVKWKVISPDLLRTSHLQDCSAATQEFSRVYTFMRCQGSGELSVGDFSFFWVPGPSCYFGILWGSMMLSPTIPYHILSGDEQTRRGGRDFPWSQWGSSLPSPMAVSGLQWPHGRGVTWCPCWLHPKLFTLPSILGSMVKWCKMWSSQV